MVRGATAVGATSGDRAPLACSGPGTESFEDAVPRAVAGLLEATDDAALLTTLRTLVTCTGGRLEGEGSGRPVDVVRGLPDALEVGQGRELTLGPVLRALCAAAAERAAGALEPPPRAGPGPTATGGHRVLGGAASVLVSLDLGDLAIVRRRLGDRGARLLMARLQRTLRTLLHADEPALRYPANRLLILLRDTTPAGARAFAERVELEWESSLGHASPVTTHQAVVVDGDLVTALRSLG